MLEEYVEYGVSGRTTQRPALQRMLTDLKTHQPTYVIIYDPSCLARNRLDDAQLMLRHRGQRRQGRLGAGDIDQTASGRLTHGVLAAVNEFRSAGDAEKVMMALRRKHSQGGTPGRAPIGYLNVRKRYLGSAGRRPVRIRSERAQVVKWAKTAALDAEDITNALTEALQRLEDPARRTSW